MGGTPRSSVGVVLLLSLGGLACGEVETPSADTSGGRRSVSSAGGAPDSGAGGNGGRGGIPASTDAGRESSDAPDSGASSGSGGARGQLPPDCPVAAPIGVPGQVIALQSINFATSEIVLRNVSASSQTVVGGRQGWQWCNYPHYWNLGDDVGNVVLEPGGTFSFFAINNESGPVALFPEGGEFAIYTTTGSFMTAELMRSFVAWGDIQAIREPTAVMAGLWTFGERVPVRSGHTGIVAVGKTDVGSGYVSVRAACLVAPPNP